jgi:phosphatidylserine/phosphatidylglycerophosphate/cardiolipin synthase-like enzyme
MSILFDQDHYREIVENGILKAEKFIWIATANIKDLYVVKGRRAHPLLQELSKLAGAGVAIRLLYSKTPSEHFQHSFDKYDNLIRGGLEMQPCARLHSKIVIVDGQMAYAGSANLTGAGLGAKAKRNHNLEVGWLTRSPEEIAQLMEYFDNIWMGKECPGCGRKEECEEPIQ